MKNAISQDTNIIQEETLLHKKIPKHRRSKFQVEVEERVLEKLDSRRDQSKRLFFRPFQFSREISNEKEVCHLRRTMKTSSKIAESFKFDLDINQDLNDKIFSQLSQEVKKTRGLKAFDIWIEGGEMYDPALKNLGIGLKPLKYLKYLKVKLLLCGDINNQGVVYLGRAIRSIGSLETLDLSFDEVCEVDDEGIKDLWRNIRYLTRLKTLNISFHYDQGVAYQEIGDIKKTFKALKSLKEIRLNFSLSDKISFEGYKNLGETFRVLTELEKIELYLWQHGYLEDEGLKELLEGIKGKSKLLKIRLEISSSPITDAGLDYLKDCLQDLSGIEEIILGLEGCENVTKEGVEELKKSLEEIPSLKHLEIKFEDENN